MTELLRITIMAPAGASNDTLHQMAMQGIADRTDVLSIETLPKLISFTGSQPLPLRDGWSITLPPNHLFYTFECQATKA